MWFAHREDGFEATSLATLREMGVPAERIAVDEAARRWPQVAFDDVAFAVLEPEGGLLMARRSVAAVARRVAELGGASEVAEARPGRVDGSRLVDVELGDGRRLAGDQFVFACGPWLPALFPEVAGDLIAVTKQDVVFVGPRAGDTRFAAASLPVLDRLRRLVLRRARGRRAGLQDRAGPLRRAVRSLVGRSDRRSRLDPPRPQLPGPSLPGPRRWADPRDPDLPVRDDAGHELRDRPPSGVRQRVARRRRFGPRLQAWAGHRPLRQPAAGRSRRRGRRASASGSTGRAPRPPPVPAPGA